MIYSKLGNTDIEVSKICLGTMNMGEQNTESEGHEQMDLALDLGVQFWDTAELYAVPSKADTQGETERIIGSWFKKTGRRSEVVLASKITGPSSNLRYIRDPLNFTEESITTALNGSLKRLQTDYIDLYQIHWPDRRTNFFGKRGYQHSAYDKWEDNMLQILESIQNHVKAGKIRCFGISNETPWGLHNYLMLSEKHDLPRPQSVQNPYNLLNRQYEVGLAEMSIRENVGLLAYSPLAFGLLSGKYHKDSNAQGRLNLFPDYHTRYNSDQCIEATRRYIDLADQWGMSPAQMSLAFINQQAFVTSNIIGATTIDQLKENIESIEIELNRSQIREIEEIHNLIPDPAP